MMQFFRKNVRSIMLVVVVLFIVSCFAGYGMYGGSDDGGQPADGGGMRDYAVAVVDGQQIMRSRIEGEMVQMIQAMGVGQTISDDDLPAIRSNVLDQMAITVELEKEIKARNVAVPKEELDATVKEIEGSFPTREIFMQEMERAGLDEKKLRDEVEIQMRRQKVFEQVVAPASADEEEVRSFYDTLKAYAFQKPESFQMNVAHFKTEASAEAARLALTDGQVWDEVMAAASGDILDHTPYESPVTIPTSGLRDNFEFIQDAPMNEVTPPVEVASDDYVLIIKRDKQEASTATYDEVSADIRQMIVGQKQQSLQSQFLQELRSRAKVEILDADIFRKEVPATSLDIAPEATSGDNTQQEEPKSEAAQSEAEVKSADQ